jgi:hypothetical protein
VLVLESKRWSGLRRLDIGFFSIVTRSVSGATPYQTFEHEDEHEHDLVAAPPRCDLLRLFRTPLSFLQRGGVRNFFTLHLWLRLNRSFECFYL